MVAPPSPDMIFVIEGSFLDRSLIRMALEPLKDKVKEFSHGIDFLTWAGEQRELSPSFILIDQGLPQESGLSIIASLLAIRPDLYSRIILMSDDIDEHFMARLTA